MSLVLAKDRVLQTSTTTGPGTYTFAGVVPGFQAFGLADGDTCRYFAADVDAGGVPIGDWEVGIGTAGGSGTTFARTVIEYSSNANAAVSWGAGTRRLSLSLTATGFNPGVAVGLVVGLPFTTNNPTLGDMTFQKVGTSVAYSATIHAPQVSLPDLWCNYGTPKTATDTGGSAAYGLIATDDAGTVVASVAAGGQLTVSTDDGANWLKLAGNWNSSDQNGSECVAVGDNGLVARSTTGAKGSWVIAHALNKTTSWKKVRWIASLSLWVAVGIAGAASTASIMTSPTGVTWTQRQTSANAVGFNSFDIGAGTLVAVGTSGGIQSSTNATSWTARASNVTGNLLDVVWSGIVWVAAGAAAGSKNGSTSTDGSTWVARLLTNSTSATVNCLMVATSYVIAGTSEIGTQSIRTSPTNDCATWTASGVAGMSGVVALGTDGTTIVGMGTGAGTNGGSSPLADGLTWTARVTTTGACTAGAIRYVGSKLIAVNNYTGASENLAEITGGTTPAATARAAGIVLGTSGSGAALRDAVYFNSTYIAFGDGLSITGSPDAATWTPQNWLPTSAPGSMVYGAGTFVVGLATGWVLVSTDAKQWIHKNTGLASGSILLSFGNSTFCASSTGASTTTNGLATSADALTWTVRTTPLTAYFWPPMYGAGVWVCVVGPPITGSIYSTTDFITFTLRASLSGAVNSNGIQPYAYVAGWFVVVVNVGGPWTSNDGITWASRSSGTTQSPGAIASNGSRIVIYDGQFTTGRYSDNGTTFTAFSIAQFAGSITRAMYVNGNFIIHNAAAQGVFGSDFYTSTDGISGLVGRQCSSAAPTTGVAITAMAAGNGKIYIAQSVAGSIAVIPDTLSEPSSIYINGAANSGRLNNYGRVK